MSAFVRGAIDFAIPTHLLAVVALALLAGRQARCFPTRPGLALTAGLVLGSGAVAFGVGETPSGLALLALAALTGLPLALALTLPLWIAAPLALAIGAALPLNAPPHEITLGKAIASQIGFAAAALAAFAAVSLIGAGATRPWQRIGVRIVGSWIAASAILVLALRLAR
jgi:hypothetical protein